MLGQGTLNSEGSTSIELADFAGPAVLQLLFGTSGSVVHVLQFLHKKISIF